MLPKDLAKGRSWEPWKIFPKIMISEFFSKVQGLLGGTNGDDDKAPVEFGGSLYLGELN